MNLEKNYKRTIKNKSIVIVGNGGSILGQNKGRAINGFDEVVRFNYYKIIGFEADVGTKTTIWFTCNCNIPTAKRKYNEVYFHSWEWNRQKSTCYKTIQQYQNNVINTKKNDVKQLAKLIPEYPHYGFSTGLIAIHILLRTYPHLHLIGFDWHLDKYDHHYGDNEPKGELHQPQLEWNYILKLHHAGKISFL